MQTFAPQGQQQVEGTPRIFGTDQLPDHVQERCIFYRTSVHWFRYAMTNQYLQMVKELKSMRAQVPFGADDVPSNGKKTAPFLV